ncbi:MAG TPA: inositol monophosphatase family protein [Pirellulales bacterium]|nr:inositol monophosphatase family protein [Pirellulales bacterium]
MSQRSAVAGCTGAVSGFPVRSAAVNLDGMSDALSDRLKLAVDAAREAGALTLRYFRRGDLQVDLKHDASPVTVADRESEQLLRRRIAAAFPEDGILGEEFGEQSGTSGYRWILDPIDGTKSFIHGVPLYAVLIGVEQSFNDSSSRGAEFSRDAQSAERSANSTSEIGVIYLPATDEMVYAAAGQGAWYVRGKAAPAPAKVSQKKTLTEGLFLTSGLTGFHKRGGWPAFERLTKAAKLTRTWGDAFGYMLVATGRAEAMVDPVMNVWDAAALLPILQEAGGTFTDWQGRPTIHSGEGIATNGLVLDEVLRLVK